MPKLLMVATVPETLRGFLLPWAKHYRAQGWKVDAMALDISTCAACVAAFDQVWDVQWSRNPINPLNLVSAPRRLRQIVQQQHYDLVHVHTPVAAFVSRYALRQLRRQSGLKVLYTAHGFHFHRGGSKLRNQIFLILEKWAGRWCDRLITINKEDHQAALKHRLVPPQQLCYTPGIGVDLSYYSALSLTEETRLQVRTQLGLKPEDVLFLTIAELIPRKRPKDLLLALAKLQRPRVHLALAGDGPLAAELKTLATQLGIAQQVHFLGFCSDIPRFIYTATATLLVSEQEGLPRSVLEAMAMGVPAIGTRIRGTEDLLKDGAGKLVTVGNSTEIATEIAWILDNPEAARMLGLQGRKQVQQYDLYQILRIHDDIYTDVLKETQPCK
jgi:glycosyltransferase involved in cell wall biosynthesis